VGGSRILVRRFSGAVARPFTGGSRITIHYANPEIRPSGGYSGLVSLLARWKREDEKRYRALWSAAAYGHEPRELRLAAILIDDRRYGFGTLRYCDVAAGEVQMISGVKFGLSQQASLDERDRAVARAAAWLKNQRATP
jgi:hypothetical protein